MALGPNTVVMGEYRLAAPQISHHKYSYHQRGGGCRNKVSHRDISHAPLRYSWSMGCTAGPGCPPCPPSKRNNTLRELAFKMSQSKDLPPVLVSVLTIGSEVNHQVPVALHSPSGGVSAVVEPLPGKQLLSCFAPSTDRSQRESAVVERASPNRNGSPGCPGRYPHQEQGRHDFLETGVQFAPRSHDHRRSSAGGSDRRQYDGRGNAVRPDVAIFGVRVRGRKQGHIDF